MVILAYCERLSGYGRSGKQLGYRSPILCPDHGSVGNNQSVEDQGIPGNEGVQ